MAHMTIRFSVEKVFDHADRGGLLVSGWILGGVIEPGTTLGDGTGAQTTVVAVDFESPEDRRTGQTTLLLARTTPSPVGLGTVLVVESSPAKPVAYTYLAIYATSKLTPPAQSLLCAEVTIGPPRTVLFTRNRTWEFDPETGATFLFDMEYQQQTRRISRTEAEQIARAELSTQLPTEPELQQMMRDGEAADS
jgi:hypothetical protein